MKSVAYSDFRRSIGEYVRLSGRSGTVAISTAINCSALMECCRAQDITPTPLFIKTIAAVARDIPELNAILSRTGLRRRVFLPDTVDMAVAIEKQWRGETFITSPVIRDAGAMTLTDIQRAVQELAHMPVECMPDMRGRLLLNRMPGLIQYACMWAICQRPHLFQRYFGTIGFSNLGACGIRTIYPVWINSAVFGLGSIMDEPIAVDGRAAVAPVAHLTLSFNHGVMDGTVAGRILNNIKTTLESHCPASMP